MKSRTFSLVALAALVLSSCGTKEAAVQTAERAEIVETSAVQKQTVSHDVELSTTLQGYLTQNVAPSVTGKIEHIYVEVGTPVKAGSNLVRMDQNQLNTTKLTFANLGVELQRMETLSKTGAVSQQTYDQTKLSYDQTKESLEFLEKNTFVKAPFAGVISPQRTMKTASSTAASPFWCSPR